MPSFILRNLDPEFWSRVQAKAAREGVTVKALILRLLTQWLAASLVVVVGGCTTGPTTPTPPPFAASPEIVLATAPSELRAFNEPRLVCAGGATQVKVFAMGYASDGVLRGVPNLPVQWMTSVGVIGAVGPMSARTDGGGLAAMVLSVSREARDGDVSVAITVGGLSATVTLPLLAQPCGHTTPPGGGTGSTGSTGSTGGTGGTGGT
jgi:hypothetical protein